MPTRKGAPVAVLAALLAVAALSGCGGGGDGNVGSTEPPPEATEAPVEQDQEEPGAPVEGPVPQPPVDGRVTVGVYLQNVGHTRAYVAYASGEDVNVVTMQGLSPDTEYPYEAKDLAGEVVHRGRLRTAPVADKRPIVFGVVGDMGYDRTIQPQLDVRDAMVRSNPALEFVITTGDNVYRSGEYERYRPALFEPYAALMNRIPFFFTMGNHDAVTDLGRPFDLYFIHPANNPQETDRYYSFDWGNVHLVALQADNGLPIDAASPQYKWLEDDLARTPPYMWQLVFFHVNLYGEESYRPGDEDLRQRLAPLFEGHGVHLVFNGHEHAYERFKPVNAIHYIVTGGGGAAPRDLNEGSARLAASSSAHHFLRVTADAATLTIEAVDTSDRVFDTLTLTR